MALQGPIEIGFDQVFPHGAYTVDDVAQVDDFDQSTRENRVQQVDKKTGLPMWAVRVHDADPEVRKGQETVTVKILSTVQPVLPEPIIPGAPFRQIEFTGMTVTPYIDERGSRAKLAYSVKATGVQAQTKGAKPAGGTSDAKSDAGKAADESKAA